jgi:DNA polymerase III epsilon subunit-like protein
MAKYLSIDTEATGLTPECVLIQLAFVPLDTTTNRVLTELGKEWMVHCKSFEELKPSLNPWVVENNEGLIRKAHATGVSPEKLKEEVHAYLTSPEMKAFFGESRPVFLGKSLSALDIPLMTRTFGDDFMRDHFHHHVQDVTCVARSFVDSGLLPPGTESSGKIMKHFGIRETPAHTALSDALDMAHIYLKLLDQVRSLANAKGEKNV